MKAGCAKEMTVSTGTVEEAEALELASLCRLVFISELVPEDNIQYNGYTDLQASFEITFFFTCMCFRHVNF